MVMAKAMMEVRGKGKVQVIPYAVAYVAAIMIPIIDAFIILCLGRTPPLREFLVLNMVVLKKFLASPGSWWNPEKTFEDFSIEKKDLLDFAGACEDLKKSKEMTLKKILPNAFK